MLMDLRGSREEMGICKRKCGTDRDGLEKDRRRWMGETGGHCFPLIPKLGSLERHMELELDYKRHMGITIGRNWALSFFFSSGKQNSLPFPKKYPASESKRRSSFRPHKEITIFACTPSQYQWRRQPPQTQVSSNTSQLMNWRL